MGKLMRSEDMSYVQLCLQVEAMHAIVHQLGERGLVHFVDVRPRCRG